MVADFVDQSLSIDVSSATDHDVSTNIEVVVILLNLIRGNREDDISDSLGGLSHEMILHY